MLKSQTNKITSLIFGSWWLLFIACVFSLSASAQSTHSVKDERLAIKEGNKAFNDGNYQKALDLYERALAYNALSEAAQFNRALTLTRLAAGNDSTMMTEAVKVYDYLGSNASDPAIMEKANYNLGNIAFHAQDYPRSIEYYKKVLRSNPANQRARENLLVAILKSQQDDDQQQQNQQDQQQQEQQQDQQEQQTPPPPQQQQQNQDANADQILQSMQNRENQTRKDVEKRQIPVGIPVTDKPW